ncbi:MAG: amidohydrolase family protein [Ignavibacteriae bacterium]|nr:amidohydrolase family protein [Ignavibacteriota bacterium]MCI0707915.1 amidohydrolase family protein [Ignavibacteriota bacterium]
MKKLFAAFLSLAVSLPLAAQVTAIKAGKMVDPKSRSVLSNQIILVEDGKIKSVGTNIAIPDNATVVDLSHYTVLPGLIDCHTHVLLQPEDEGAVPPVITKSQAFRTVQAVAAAKKDLEAGFTTMRDVDSEGAGFADVAVRDGINKGIIPGPRLLVSTYALTITGGHMNLSGMNPDLNLPDPAAITNTREEMVNEVRREVKYGADWIKLYATGTLRHVNPLTLESLSQVSVEDIQAVVNEAKRWGKDVAAHAYGGDGAKNSIIGGVRSIEHGMLMDDATIQLLVKHGTYWCPTLSVYFPHDQTELNDFRKRIIQSHKEVFQKAMKAGVKIAFGTDVGAFEHGAGAQEFLRMVEYGMKPIDAIRSATVTASELLRMEHQLGTVEAGKLADIIAVEGDPVTDINALTKVAFVMKEGTIHKNFTK